MAKLLWRTYKKYSGPMIQGSAELLPPRGDRAPYHVDRAFWLTAKVETGAKFGSVMAYDGTGMTAGLDQHVAVYPADLSRPDDGNALDDQGTLWKLLRRIEMVPDIPETQVLWEAFSKLGWYVAQDGVLRGKYNGSPLPGRNIREILTPHNGNPLASSLSIIYKAVAEDWAWLFHKLFSNPQTYKAQIEYGKEHLVKRTTRRVIVVGGKRKSVASFYPTEITSLNLNTWTPAADLAMCVYQSHSVNAPSIANKALAFVLAKQNDDWPKRLIQRLGNSKYGRWDDDIKYGRYQRTRSAARASGLWPRTLFDGKDAIMPKNLDG